MSFILFSATNTDMDKTQQEIRNNAILGEFAAEELNLVVVKCFIEDKAFVGFVVGCSAEEKVKKFCEKDRSNYLFIGERNNAFMRAPYGYEEFMGLWTSCSKDAIGGEVLVAKRGDNYYTVKEFGE